MLLVDLDGDADKDLAVVANDSEIGPAVQVLINKGLGNPDVIFGDPIAFDVEADPKFVVSADFDRNGLIDPVTVNEDEGETGAGR